MKHILLVDDNKDNLENFSEILQMSGYRVTIANNGEQALKRVMSMAPDLILCDIMMPEMNGINFKKKLNEWTLQTRSFEIPFIFLTACSTPPYIEEAKSLGISAYIVKPAEIGRILETIENVCGFGVAQ